MSQEQLANVLIRFCVQRQHRLKQHRLEKMQGSPTRKCEKTHMLFQGRRVVGD